MSENIKILKVNTDNLIQIYNLSEALEGTEINDALITVHIRGLGGLDVPGVTWPMAFTFVNQSNGRYYVIIPASAEFIQDNMYEATVRIETPEGKKAEWKLKCIAKIDFLA